MKVILILFCLCIPMRSPKTVFSLRSELSGLSKQEEIPEPPKRDLFYQPDKPFRRLPSKLFVPTIDEMWEYEIDKIKHPNKPVLEPIL